MGTLCLVAKNSCQRFRNIVLSLATWLCMQRARSCPHRYLCSVSTISAISFSPPQGPNVKLKCVLSLEPCQSPTQAWVDLGSVLDLHDYEKIIQCIDAFFFLRKRPFFSKMMEKDFHIIICLLKEIWFYWLKKNEHLCPLKLLDVTWFG